MRCSRCQFENMPGLTNCMRCGTILTAPQAPVEVHPPRMAGWKGPIRSFFRSLRRAGILRPLPMGRLSKAVETMLSPTLFGVVFSVVPGLAHTLTGRARQIRWFLGLWVALAFLTVFFFGGHLGMMFLGLTVGTHAWIALHAGFLREERYFRERAVAFVLILTLYAFAYYHGRSLLSTLVHLGHSRVSVPARDIAAGDVFIGVRMEESEHPAPRGALVCADLRSIGPRVNSRGYVQIIGLPGETIYVQEGAFCASDQRLDAERFPVPAWLQNREFKVAVPEGHYFISAEYTGAGYNQQHIAAACLIPRQRVQARAYLQWWPIARRGFVRTEE